MCNDKKRFTMVEKDFHCHQWVNSTLVSKISDVRFNISSYVRSENRLVYLCNLWCFNQNPIPKKKKTKTILFKHFLLYYLLLLLSSSFTWPVEENKLYELFESMHSNAELRQRMVGFCYEQGCALTVPGHLWCNKH